MNRPRLTDEQTNIREPEPASKPANAWPMDVLLVDPSLFTAPYDGALSQGLRTAGVRPLWATRALRAGEEDALSGYPRSTGFYRWTDGPRRRAGSAARALKGIEHVIGMRALVRQVHAGVADLVHFQWILLPLLDAAAMRRIRRHRPLVLTVHDTTPFNGKAVSAAQRRGFAAALAIPDRLIVHTPQGRDALVAAGLDLTRIRIVPHGPLHSAAPVKTSTTQRGRWRIVQFGKVQDYKGVDILIEALGRLNPAVRERISVVVAGEPMMDVASLRARARDLDLPETLIEFRFRRQSDAEMEAILAEADMFIFPYRAIEASGVLFLVAGRGKWIVASDLGAFSGLIGHDGEAGTLTPPADPIALAIAIEASIGRRPSRDIAADITGWDRIGAMTRDVYFEARDAWRLARRAA